jgi:periplasmic copper chaperone A
MKNKLIVVAVLIAALAIPALAAAHVTLQPEEVPAGGFNRFDVRVPNERDDAATEKVEVEMPDGFVFASYEPVPGWTVDVAFEKLDEPIEAFGEEIDEQVNTITWTADDPNAAIQPGQFRDFGLSVGIPDSAQPGDTLTFKAIQTYDNGEVVRWIGAPDADEPAPTVAITAPADEEAEAAAHDEEATATADDDADEDGEDEGAPTWLVIVALVLGAAGLGAGVTALRRSGS